ncbi:class I SAM-dependent methyltransferase [Streptomyces cavernicola]|uniref:Methyltransferase domain-containing protein n=1 Tax=Streptomyces cavernicola TaxID=3043613 RepID=A0ABT6SE92_9ACTN|nr:methyltransferase domain-containing protein [Streptomyces sp. B-S-A6]MDI3406498.1 methyltransferase domain-containing protein [Streptomyces sp. B-S-A6]
MTPSTDAVETDRALKAKHRKMWALGNYPAVASQLIPSLGPVLVEACGVRVGRRVLDVAAGSGNAAIPAAATGAEVVALDLTPELFDAGRERAAEEGVAVEWREGDAEALPFPDEDFDTVMSCVGIMFAPHHQAAADEALRVLRPGGTVGLISWTPTGAIGELFKTMKPYAPTPPPGAQPPPLWGTLDHVRELFGDRVTDLDAQTRTVHIGLFQEPADCREFFKNNYGPTIAIYRNIADDPDRVRALDGALDALAQRCLEDGGTDGMDWEYLLVTARKA